MSDEVLRSVAAYTPHAANYAAAHAGKVADLLARFAGSTSPGAYVLDAGCGPGRDLKRFVEYGLAPVGVDLNAAFLTLASAHAPVIRADLRRLPFGHHLFEGVWASASLVHLSDAQAMAALAEFSRVTTPGGLVYVSVKGGGAHGWRDTRFGRRWFNVWTDTRLASTARAAGLVGGSMERSGEFLNMWARTRAGSVLPAG